MVFYRARLVNTSNNAVVVACQMSTHATSARNHFVSNVYMTGTVGPVMIFQRLYVSSVSMTDRIILSCTARDTRPIFVECAAMSMFVACVMDKNVTSAAVCFNLLNCCSTMVCAECVIPRECDECVKKYCESDERGGVNKQCGTCYDSFCVDCRE